MNINNINKNILNREFLRTNTLRGKSRVSFGTNVDIFCLHNQFLGLFAKKCDCFWYIWVIYCMAIRIITSDFAKTQPYLLLETEVLSKNSQKVCRLDLWQVNGTLVTHSNHIEVVKLIKCKYAGLKLFSNSFTIFFEFSC